MDLPGTYVLRNNVPLPKEQADSVIVEDGDVLSVRTGAMAGG